MKKHFSYRRIYSGVLYSVLAVCMLAVVGVSVYTLTYDYGSLTNISLPEISYPSFGNDVSSPGIIDKPVGKDESGIPAETSDPDPEQVYVNPCSGNILKNYTLTALLYSETMNDYRTHSGVDISGELYSPVYAYTDGTVVDIYDDPFMGTTVVVEHDFALTTYYMNLSPETPSGIDVGSVLQAGDIIGSIGNSAILECSAEPHLHFEMRVENKLIDPLPELINES